MTFSVLNPDMTTEKSQFPAKVRSIADKETFCFQCHPERDCFTHCCRQLELSLSPYDVLRLKKATGLSSADFLDRYVIIEHEQNDVFPRLYLTMVDDGRASCVFISAQGCTCYEDRPGACRAYPVGRGVAWTQQNTVNVFHVLVEEDHCHGFGHGSPQTMAAYCLSQGLAPYNHFNDAVASILHHESVRHGKQFSPQEVEYFLLSLYNLDTFRKEIVAGRLPSVTLSPHQLDELEQDEPLLLFAIDWLKRILFHP